MKLTAKQRKRIYERAMEAILTIPLREGKFYAALEYAKGFKPYQFNMHEIVEGLPEIDLWTNVFMDDNERLTFLSLCIALTDNPI